MARIFLTLLLPFFATALSYGQTSFTPTLNPSSQTSSFPDSYNSTSSTRCRGACECARKLGVICKPFTMIGTYRDITISTSGVSATSTDMSTHSSNPSIPNSIKPSSVSTSRPDRPFTSPVLVLPTPTAMKPTPFPAFTATEIQSVPASAPTTPISASVRRTQSTNMRAGTTTVTGTGTSRVAGGDTTTPPSLNYQSRGVSAHQASEVLHSWCVYGWMFAAMIREMVGMV